MPPRFTATTEAASSRQVAFSVEEHEDGRAEVMARVEARVHMQLAALREGVEALKVPLRPLQQHAQLAHRLPSHTHIYIYVHATYTHEGMHGMRW